MKAKLVVVALIVPGLVRFAAGVEPPRQTNLIKNPGFEEQFKGWNRPRPRTEADRRRRLDLVLDQHVVHSGRAAARLTLDYQQNAQIYAPTQTVSVSADTKYELTAYVRTRLSDGTVHLELQDTRGWQLFIVQTRPLSGHNDWTKVQLAFRTSLTTEAIRIGLRHVRRPNDKMPLRGRVWLEDVSLVAQETGRPRLTRAELERAIRDCRSVTLQNDSLRIALAAGCAVSARARDGLQGASGVETGGRALSGDPFGGAGVRGGGGPGVRAPSVISGFASPAFRLFS